jgi:predicted DCC family thiol-disulfide oxidoreductase YuxK
MTASAETRLVVFDGLCNVCSGGARFLQRHEIKPLSSTFADRP